MQSRLGFWNKTKKVWIFQGNDTLYNKITKILQSENCHIEETEVKQSKEHPSSSNKEKKDDITLDEAGRDVLKVFNHTMQIRRLSERTQDIYRPFFKKFLAAFPGEDIRTFTYGKIYDYVKKRTKDLGHTQTKQMMAAIKFYYERIQGRKTMFFNLNSEYEKVNLTVLYMTFPEITVVLKPNVDKPQPNK